GADAVPQVHRHDGCGVVLRIEHLEAVGQGEALVVHAARLGGERRGGRRRGPAREAHAIRTHGRAAPLQAGPGEGAHSGAGTTGPEWTSSKANTPSRVSPFTMRRGAVRVA